jgi:pimeloyl-ACP methyl ester carboxylesterase
MKAKSLLIFGLALVGADRAIAAALPLGYHAKVAVSAPTRLDWTFVLTNRSLASPPADWLGDYHSKRQSYELFVPPRRDARKLLPAIVFISPGNEPMGWKHFENVCKQRGILFAGPRGAGNDCPPKKRVRLVLDVLDDVRRNYPTDPDRTYLAGFSGGGRIACAIAFTLPEYVGGVMPICAGGELRGESWLRQRVRERLGVALLTGEKDFNRAEVERLRGPLLQGVGVTARVWVRPGMGHDVPSEKTLLEAIRWLDESAPRRQEAAKRDPASRIDGAAAPGREEQAQALFAEAKKRLGKRETLYSGLMQLKGCMQRWPDLQVGADAKTILLEYDGRTERPWDADDLAEQRRFLIARVRALDGYASGDLPPQYAKERPDAAREAIQLWQKVLADGPDTAAGREAKKRIPALEKIAAPEK